MQPDLVTSLKDDAFIFGHTLMASFPPISYIEEHPHEPFPYESLHETMTMTTTKSSGGSAAGGMVAATGGGQGATEGGPTGASSAPYLAALLELSSRLDLDGEITPVMAWTMILSHPRSALLGKSEIELLRDELSGKIRCHG